MSWTKYLRPHTSHVPLTPMVQPQSGGDGYGSATSARYASYLPEVYAGHPSRIQRYTQYEEMNRDAFVRTALDTLAEFCTQSEEANEIPFDIQYLSDANETEVELLKGSLQLWTTLNDFPSRLFTMFRNTLMNGDSFYLRDPETKEWTFLDHFSVAMARVDEERGHKISEYLINGFDDFRQAKYSTTKADMSQFRGKGDQKPQPFAMNSFVSGGGSSSSSQFQIAGSEKNGRSNRTSDQDAVVISAEHVIHLSMSDGLDVNWPFGPSILESVFKVWKQKELLEDAIIIYRVSRAPERRVFYVDVGQSNPIVARGIVEGVKNEIHNRRIPNAIGGGQSMLDAAHNPLSMLDDYFLPQTSEGRGSKVEVLPGGDSVGEITDLTYFMKHLAAAFKIPATYLPLFSQDQGATSYNDGKLGTATIQEFMFNKYCMRLQNRIIKPFDDDFKRFLKDQGIDISSTLFRLKFVPPQNFTKYREIELQSQRVNLFTQIIGVPFISKTMAMKEFLDWSEDKIIENERLWKRENPDKLRAATGQSDAESEQEGGLADVGIRGGMGGMGDMGDMGMEPDLGGEGDMGGDAGGGDAGGDAGAGGMITPMGAGGGGAPPPA